MAPQSGEWNVALVGASTLKGKEVRSVFEERGFPVRRMLLLDSEEMQGQLSEFDGEPAIVQPITRETFESIDLVIFACSPAFTEQHWQQARSSGARILDLSYFLEKLEKEDATTQVAAPLIGLPLAPSGPDVISVPAHPASIAMAGILRVLARRSLIRNAVIVIHAPASERGQSGVEELHQQTVNLLSFKELPQTVFDAQVAFNMLSRHGETARPTMAEDQERIQCHLRFLLGSEAVRPALRVLQVPVFHGYSFVCWVELDHSLPQEEIHSLLNQSPFSVSATADAPPTLASAASSDEILLGSVEADAVSGGYWIWGVFDNLRIAALNAERIAENLYAAVEADSAHPRRDG
jgi:aspartate-semialdehyde dehydrogenase